MESNKTSRTRQGKYFLIFILTTGILLSMLLSTPHLIIKAENIIRSKMPLLWFLKQMCPQLFCQRSVAPRIIIMPSNRLFRSITFSQIYSFPRMIIIQTENFKIKILENDLGLVKLIIRFRLRYNFLTKTLSPKVKTST